MRSGPWNSGGWGLDRGRPRGALGSEGVNLQNYEGGAVRSRRLRCRGPSFVNIAVLGAISKGHLLADLVAIIGSIDIVLGEVDR